MERLQAVAEGSERLEVARLVRRPDLVAEVQARLREDPRWRVNAAYVFTTSILRAEEVPG
ncbi:hypothetical protein [Roseicella aquatilis]|uniref:Uncharacterized protein n=1 Tax=Roseicella aquatilis TaxID=2527868 RepID=A0A4R4DSU8_9PROT|nr:hypothetical protein [Roseicella aquatilis]TCZ64866.1 hypothetical protein EXY23_05700 [Roseicella aquatilis]